MDTLRAPCRKPRVYQDVGAPLPIPVGSKCEPATSCSWSHYRAHYKNGVITVSDPKQAHDLWHNGYFGHNRVQEIDKSEAKAADEGGTLRMKKRWKLMEFQGLKDDAPPIKRMKNVENCIKMTDESVCTDNPDQRQGCSENDNKNVDTNMEDHHNKINESILVEKEKSENNDSQSGTSHPAKLLDCTAVMCVNSERQLRITRSACQAYLELLPEEALFLSYALGCLTVTSETVAGRRQRVRTSYGVSYATEMSIDQMWDTFTEDDPTFAAKYAVYHHYRTKRWIVKSGLKFGADWMLYPVGPPFYHSQYTIMIQCVWSDDLSQDYSLSWREFSWTNIAATERLNSHVNKTPLICFLLRPRTLSRESLRKISCLKDFTIQELALSRWNPNEHDETPLV